MKNPIYLYNTLTKQKERFDPLSDNEVRMYNCGPTVYDYVHIGNLRSYIFADILRRTLEWNGYKVKQVINITDVGHLTTDADTGEDKMMKALKREGKEVSLESMEEVADKYTEAFIENLETLNIKLPEGMPRASRHIGDDIEMIKGLEEKGLIYKTSDGIYFDTSKIDYGKLGGLSETQEARIEENQEKKSPRDFALWKFSADNIGWDSPWGRGFPGWHIECSAMSMKYLGETFDIHTGGIDHIPVHHNNEIAQSESYTGKQFARFWLHNAFVNVSVPSTSLGIKKMAKSEGTGLTLNDIKEKGFSPLAYRYWLLGAHYRSPVDFSWEALEGAENALQRIYQFVLNLGLKNGSLNQEYLLDFERAINDDLDTPKALSVMWSLIGDEKVQSDDKRSTLRKMDEVFGIGLIEISEKLQTMLVPENIKELARKRDMLRKAGNFNNADEIRKQVEQEGYRIKDTNDGYVILPIINNH